MDKRSIYAVVICTVLLASGRGAGASDFRQRPMFSIDGYGTFGIAHSSDDQADYIPSLLRPNGTGHTRDWTPDVDSRIGVQVTANFTPKFSATLQVVSEQRFDDSYSPAVEWANIQYRFSPDFDVRIGRTVFPVFLFADSRKVGYTYPWVRPPTGLYYSIPVTNSDGVDTTYTQHFGDVTNTLQLFYGQVNFETPLGRDKINTARDTLAVMSTAEYGSLTTRLSYHHTRLTLPAFEPLFDAFKQFGPEGVSIAEQYGANDKRLRYLGLGINYDPGKWFAIGEWGSFRFDSVVGNSTAWYVSAGRRFGNLTPYFSYTHLNLTSNISDPGLTVAALPPPLAGPATGLNAALNQVLARPAQKTVSFGLRWDFMRNVALKVQYEHIRRDSGSPGTFTNIQPGFELGGKAELFSVALDFVF